MIEPGVDIFTLPSPEHDTVLGLLEYVRRRPTQTPVSGKVEAGYQLIDPDGERIDVPTQVHDALMVLLEAMLSSPAATVSAPAALLTVAEIAEILDVPRREVVRHMAHAELPYSRPDGTRWLAKIEDVLLLRDRLREQAFDDLLNYADETGDTT